MSTSRQIYLTSAHIHCRVVRFAKGSGETENEVVGIPSFISYHVKQKTGLKIIIAPIEDCPIIRAAVVAGAEHQTGGALRGASCWTVVGGAKVPCLLGLQEVIWERWPLIGGCWGHLGSKRVNVTRRK